MKIEKEARRRRRLRAFERILLASALVGGLLLIGGAPSPQIVCKYFKQKRKEAQFKYQARTALGRLERQGLIYFEFRNGKQYARPTREGEKLLALSGRYAAQQSKRWDKRWRIILFDIPERRRKVRDALRRFMTDYGFVRLQDSAWVYPHDCEDIVELAKAHFRLGTSVLYMIVENIDDDVHLRKHFSL